MMMMLMVRKEEEAIEGESGLTSADGRSVARFEVEREREVGLVQQLCDKSRKGKGEVKVSV